MPQPMSRSTQERPPRFSDPTTFVTFYIGRPSILKDNLDKFIVHKEFVCFYCPVFKAAFENDRFIEGRTQTYHLEDTTKGVFQLFVSWLYSQKLDIPEYDKGKWEESYEEMKTLIGLWVLADKLILPKLQNMAMEAIRKICEDANEIYDVVIPFIWKNTAYGSILRRYSLALRTYELNEDQFLPACPVSSKCDCYPATYWMELAQFMLEGFRKSGGEIEVSDFYVNVDISQKKRRAV